MVRVPFNDSETDMLSFEMVLTSDAVIVLGVRISVLVLVGGIRVLVLVVVLIEASAITTTSMATSPKVL
jgi:hypothetical protein